MILVLSNNSVATAAIFVEHRYVQHFSSLPTNGKMLCARDVPFLVFAQLDLPLFLVHCFFCSKHQPIKIKYISGSVNLSLTSV